MPPITPSTSTEQPADKKPRKRRDPDAPRTSISSTLADPAGTQLTFRGLVRKDGTWTVFAIRVRKDAKGTLVVNERGATTIHSDLTAAQKQIDHLTAVAIEKGWAKRMLGRGASRQDAFDADALPSPTRKAK